MYANITGSVSEYLLRSRKRLNLRFILFQVPIYKFHFSRGFSTLSFVVIEILNYAQKQIFQPISSFIGTGPAGFRLFAICLENKSPPKKSYANDI